MPALSERFANALAYVLYARSGDPRVRAIAAEINPVVAELQASS